MGTKILLIALIVVSASVMIAVVASRPTAHKHSENCKWIAPLTTQYVMCDDGVVRPKE